MGKCVDLQRRMNICDWLSRTIYKYRLVAVNTQIRSMKRPSMFRRSSHEASWHNIAIQTLCVHAKRSCGRSGAGTFSLSEREVCGPLVGRRFSLHWAEALMKANSPCMDLLGICWLVSQTNGICMSDSAQCLLLFNLNPAAQGWQVSEATGISSSYFN